MKLLKTTIPLLLLSLINPKPTYAWLCTGQQQYPPFHLCGDLFAPTLLVAAAFFVSSIVLFIIAAIYAYVKKDKASGKTFLKYRLIALGIAIFTLLLFFPPQQIFSFLTVREITY